MSTKNNLTETIECFADICPEAAAKKDALERAAAELVLKYSVQPEFFDGDDRTISLVFAANVYDDSKQLAGKPAVRIKREHDLAANVARQLFGDYSLTHPHEDVVSAPYADSREELEILRRYENPILSGKLKEYMLRNDKLAEVRKDLNIRSSDDLKYIPMVLGIGTARHTRNFGKREDSPEGVTEYVERLNDRGQKFLAEYVHSDEAKLSQGWVTTIDSDEYLCLPESIAKIILEPETVGYDGQSDVLDEGCVGVIGHELVHTVGSLILSPAEAGQPISYEGVLLEEYRAEVFSGFYQQRSGYGDLYTTISCVETRTGGNVASVVRAFRAGGVYDKLEFYATLSAEVGLYAGSLLAVVPLVTNLDYESTRATKSIYSAAGGAEMGNILGRRMSDDEWGAYYDRLGIQPESDWPERLERYRNQ